jgi:predicted amidohydrolase
VGANAARVAAAAAEAGAALLLTPELSLTGYDLRESASSLALPLAPGARLDGQYAPLAAAEGFVVAGMVERGDDEVPYNAAVLFERGVVRHVHRKIYLPTYGMFDEGRFFGHGNRLEPVPLPGGWRAGLLVCEDFWHPALSYVLAAAGIDALCVAAAAPGRGVWEGSAHGDFASTEAWERIASHFWLYSIYVLSQSVGVEGGVTFAGGSLIGRLVMDRAPSREGGDPACQSLSRRAGACLPPRGTAVTTA